MINYISKLLLLTFTLATFGVGQVIANDIKDKKIEQLEILLETYIEENRELKQRLEKIESVPQNSASSDTATTPKQPIEHNSAKPTCEQNLELCDRVELCKIATYKVNGAKGWKVGYFKKFADEAKRRNITCEVDGGIKTAGSLCEENLTACDATLLCKMSTHMSRYYENGKLIDNRAWFKGAKHKRFVEEAKSRNLSCGVMDLIAKAERNQQEAKEEAKLQAEAEAKRKAKEEARLAAETEVKSKEAEAKAKRKTEEELIKKIKLDSRLANAFCKENNSEQGKLKVFGYEFCMERQVKGYNDSIDYIKKYSKEGVQDLDQIVHYALKTYTKPHEYSLDNVAGIIKLRAESYLNVAYNVSIGVVSKRKLQDCKLRWTIDGFVDWISVDQYTYYGWNC